LPGMSGAHPLQIPKTRHYREINYFLSWIASERKGNPSQLGGKCGAGSVPGFFAPGMAPRIPVFQDCQAARGRELFISSFLPSFNGLISYGPGHRRVKTRIFSPFLKKRRFTGSPRLVFFSREPPSGYGFEPRPAPPLALKWGSGKGRLFSKFRFSPACP